MITVKRAMLLVLIFCIWSVLRSPAQSPRRIEITSKKFTYDPDVITLKKGEPVILVLRSSDVTHGLKIDEFNVNSENITKGKDVELQFTPEEVGHYVGECSHFCGSGHGSMKLQIDVVP